MAAVAISPGAVISNSTGCFTSSDSTQEPRLQLAERGWIVLNCREHRDVVSALFQELAQIPAGAQNVTLSSRSNRA
ncbi:MAG: hypothetical protein IPK60_00045 [Sandaracinaceae bacterium]|nr:hypothetical protein [Sandaracinaceae bacterium]